MTTTTPRLAGPLLAIAMLRRLQSTARDCGLEFGVKLSNTLEVENRREVFSADEKMMYLSGRPLHAITVNLAAVLADEFDGDLPMSFSAGASSSPVLSGEAGGPGEAATLLVVPAEVGAGKHLANPVRSGRKQP